MWPATASSGGSRSRQASAGTSNNTLEPGRSGKKKGYPEPAFEKLTDSRHQLIKKSELTVDFHVHNMILEIGIWC